MLKHLFWIAGLMLTVALALCIIAMQALIECQKDEDRDASFFDMLVQQVHRPTSSLATAHAHLHKVGT